MKQTSGSIPSFPSLTPRSLFLPISLTHICCFQVVTPLTRRFASSLQLLISKNGICVQFGTTTQGSATGTGSHHTLPGQLQGKHKLRRNGLCSFHKQGSPVKRNCCDKLPLDPEISNLRTVRQSGYYLFWWHIAPRCSQVLVAWPLSSWSEVTEFSFAGHVYQKYFQIINTILIIFLNLYYNNYFNFY